MMMTIAVIGGLLLSGEGLILVDGGYQGADGVGGMYRVAIDSSDSGSGSDGGGGAGAGAGAGGAGGGGGDGNVSRGSAQ